ncbi:MULTISPECIES: hypothetical protein [unclassified Afipia]|uniref:hypothetical protein n=1 Tax=unclassified Afipia TaxID=2642050 RepID=UPI000421CB2B|nr:MULTISPECIES: hypothetical protein [unclassified Afipia]
MLSIRVSRQGTKTNRCADAERHRYSVFIHSKLSRIGNNSFHKARYAGRITRAANCCTAIAPLQNP